MVLPPVAPPLNVTAAQLRRLPRVVTPAVKCRTDVRVWGQTVVMLDSDPQRIQRTTINRRCTSVGDTISNRAARVHRSRGVRSAPEIARPGSRPNPFLTPMPACRRLGASAGCVPTLLSRASAGAERTEPHRKSRGDGDRTYRCPSISRHRAVALTKPGLR
jgi:hypothetical protein